MPRLKKIVMEPHSVSVDEDLNNAAKQVKVDDMKSKAEAPITPEVREHYARRDRDIDFGNALKKNGGKIPKDGVVCLESSRNGVKPGKEKLSYKSDKKWSKDNHNNKLSKRKRKMLTNVRRGEEKVTVILLPSAVGLMGCSRGRSLGDGSFGFPRYILLVEIDYCLALQMNSGGLHL
ncbi:hypothetical protein RIF29_25829 [Crotalaria pallida]|uniref:Uncharacterized protein n=1 Tax=Crotalaria pallida TaxID=3830 RepID=A0AAN9I1C5_CROPI